MSTNHTPGPWALTPRFQDKVDVVHQSNAIGAASGTICRVTVRATWLDEQLANAHLISAAPDLMNALRLMLRGTKEDCGRICMPDEEAVRAAFSAIAKAEGKD